MRLFTWMAVLGAQGPPGIPKATPLPVPEKTPSQCSCRHFHSPRVQGSAHLPKQSMRLPGAKPPTAAQSSHHATHNLRELTTRRGELTKRYTNQVQTSTSHTKWNAKKHTSLSQQEPACKYSSNGITERSSTFPRLHWSSCKSTGTAGIDTSQSTLRDVSCRRYRYRPQQKNRR